MADDKQKNADFIGHVVGDPKNPQETRMLTGWFGESGEEGYRRLYTDAELKNYVDIPDDAILYTEPLRDVQPAGGVIVWIKSDAALKPGGSASSRAARFLQGQVQQDFASAGAAGSLEKAGLRCATQVPCGEPTGFTGECTNQPEVGGAWPCITAIPHCFEVTGFTGKCTHAPWPNPTRYIGCTHLHCPTYDLTHIPHICNIVASGNPGCVVINPPQGGDPAQKAGAAADAEAKPLPATEIPGCGYTKSWGVCETHLLGCGYTKEWGNQCPTHLPDCPTAAPGCGWSRNPVCTDLPGCNWTKQPAICHQTVSQGMVPCTGPLPVDDIAAQRGAAAQPASILCATNIGCDITLLCHTVFCHTHFPALCFPTLICPTQPQQCFPIPSPFCPVTQACPFGTGGGGDPVQGGGGGQQQAFAARAVAPRPLPLTPVGCPASDFVACSQFGGCPTLPQQFAAAGQGGGCTQSGPLCHTYPRGDCTFFGCPSPGIDCTVVVCTHIGPQCPHPSLQGQLCPITVGSPQCPPPHSLQPQLCPITVGGPQCPPVSGGFQCPSALCQSIACQSIACQPGGGVEQQAFARHVNVPVTQQTLALLCTQVGPQCPQTQALGCTQFGPQCNSALCPPPSQVGFCPPATSGGPQCPPVSGTFRCPSALCQSIACQSVACQPGGGGQQQAFAAAQPQPGGGIHPTIWTQIGPQCPPHLTGGIDCTVVFCTHAGPHCPPTPATVCTQSGPQCHTHLHPICPTGGVDCTVVICTHVGPLCPPNTHPPQCPAPTPLCLTVAGPHCPTHTIQGPACPVLTAGGPQCPPASGFNCPSVAGCQSVACQSAACQPGGGGQQEAFAARAAAGGGGGIGVTAWLDCTQFGPQCPPFFTLFEQQCVVQPNFTFDVQCLTPPPPTPACPTPHCPPHSHQFVVCTAFGPQCHRTVVEARAPQPAGGIHPTPATHCFVCDPQAAAAVPHTQIIVQCNPSLIDACPTRLIVQCHPSVIDACPSRLCTHQLIQCNPSIVDACPTRIGCPTQNPAQCPPASGFNCPSQLGCQSIACQSAGCQPGGGGHQVFGAVLPPHTRALECFSINAQCVTPLCTGTIQCTPTRIGCN